MPNPKNGFTMIELMIVVGIMAILAMIAVMQYARYLEGARETAARYLLQNLARAELTIRADDRYGGVLAVDGGPSSINNLLALGEFGFRPDPVVGFAAIPYDGEEPGAFILYAAYAKTRAKVFVYNFAPRDGVRELDPGAAYMAVTPSTLRTYKWSSGSGGVTVAAERTLTLDTSAGKVSTVSP
jgi:prepilin-type N-terminal cleavage/methylation domain